MNKIACTLLGMTLVLSCTKDNNTIPQIDLTGLPVSYTLSLPSLHLGIQNRFAYDQSNDLASVSLYTADTVAENVSVDSGSYYFTKDPSVNLPTGYL